MKSASCRLPTVLLRTWLYSLELEGLEEGEGCLIHWHLADTWPIMLIADVQVGFYCLFLIFTCLKSRQKDTHVHTHTEEGRDLVHTPKLPQSWDWDKWKLRAWYSFLVIGGKALGSSYATVPRVSWELDLGWASWGLNWHSEMGCQCWPSSSPKQRFQSTCPHFLCLPTVLEGQMLCFNGISALLTVISTFKVEVGEKHKKQWNQLVSHW